MSASVPRELASRVTARPPYGRHRARPAVLRFGASLDRALWPSDRSLAELRWSALTFGIILAMALPAHLVADTGGRFGQVAAVSLAGLMISAALAWSPAATRIAQTFVLRRAIGPIVVLVALAAVGAYDPVTLASPPGRPFLILALTYAALTPGFWIAVGILLLASLGLFADHARLTGSVFDPAGVDFTIRLTVTILGGVAVQVIDRGLRRQRRLAERLAARKVAEVDQLEGLQRIVRRFDGSRPVALVMQDVVDDLATTFGITLVSAYLPDEQGRLAMVGVAGYDSPFHIIQTGVGIIGRAAETGSTVYVADVLADPGYRAARPDVRSEVAVPVMHGSELLGIVNFEGNAAHPITSAHVAIAEMLARSIAGALRSARLDDERRHRLHAIERVLEVSRGLTSDLDRPRVVASVVEAARDLLDADTVEFASRGKDGTFRVEHALGEGAARVGDEIKTGIGMAGAVIATEDRVIWNGDRGGRGRPVGLGFVIRLDDGLSGILTAARERSDRPFTEADITIADLLVTQIEAALHNAELHARMSEAAVRDPLTGLLNRRYFDEAVEAAFANAARTDTELSLIVLDLDRFSEVNNVHGHSVGDAVLRRVARAMASVVRTGDILARFGGEEFVVIAPSSDRARAVKLAERIRAAVAAESVRPIDGLLVPITISAGVASRLGDEADGRALFRAADSALLAAKRAGRDRVVSL